ncbi:hypothetical protein N7540_011129 [Penicillium herquei]|nr:hypothetical protein N7540_011129 [Penicillium herquei]
MSENPSSGWQILVEEPPSYTKHDWRSAKKFWEARDSKTWVKRWMDSVSRDAYFLLSMYEFKSWRSLQSCQRSSLQARSEVKRIRRNLNHEKTISESIGQTQEVIYGHYAKTMNDIESLTGKIMAKGSHGQLEYNTPVSHTTSKEVAAEVVMYCVSRAGSFVYSKRAAPM